MLLSSDPHVWLRLDIATLMGRSRLQDTRDPAALRRALRASDRFRRIRLRAQAGRGSLDAIRSHGPRAMPAGSLSQVTPRVQAIAVLFRPAIADVFAVVHVGDHDVSHPIVGLALRLAHRRSDATDNQD